MSGSALGDGGALSPLAGPAIGERLFAFLDRHTEDVKVGSWVRAMDRDGWPLKRIKKQPVLLDEVKAQLLFNYCISHCSVMGRTAVLREHRHHNDFFRC